MDLEQIDSGFSFVREGLIDQWIYIFNFLQELHPEGIGGNFSGIHSVLSLPVFEVVEDLSGMTNVCFKLLKFSNLISL